MCVFLEVAGNTTLSGDTGILTPAHLSLQWGAAPLLIEIEKGIEKISRKTENLSHSVSNMALATTALRSNFNEIQSREQR